MDEGLHAEELLDPSEPRTQRASKSTITIIAATTKIPKLHFDTFLLGDGVEDDMFCLL